MRMIIDYLKNASRYKHVCPGLETAFAFLAKESSQTLSAGKYPVDGEKIHASVDEYETKPESACKWESHKKYLDIQVLLSGSERMGYAPVGSMIPRTEYDAQKDVLFYNGTGDSVLMLPGMFAIFMPDDAHMPKICNGKPEHVKKVVIKVMVDGGSF